MTQLFEKEQRLTIFDDKDYTGVDGKVIHETNKSFKFEFFNIIRRSYFYVYVPISQIISGNDKEIVIPNWLWRKIFD